ncbi:3' terminal RNA ribose 2'-O-methyltransferase Hen1 [Chloroflexia bacterium SDU3-3]|nr:3' terminal RNA ribose 2'-O-methyltransferase Hen1 [Chloroflexia bacterium SDU3-3]
MLLTISTTHRPATDLGFLLVKNPVRAQSFELSFGKAHVLYPEASEERCTAALLLDIDPVGLVRGRSPGADGPLDQYVNDRPYVASSFLSVALAQVFGSALNGKSRDRPELAGLALPMEASISALPARGGEPLLRRLFEPLGYAVEVERLPLDERFPDWGASDLYRLRLAATCTVADLLAHLYVLIPVLDADKHYYFGPDEVEKLLRRGEGWLASHPEKNLITLRYLKRRQLIRSALAQLVEPGDEGEDDEDESADRARRERRESLHELRLGAALAVLKGCGAARVLDLGCGEGKLTVLLAKEPQFREIVGMDVAYRSLEVAQRRVERLAAAQRQRVRLFQGSLTYADARLAGYDAAAVVEVIEHMDEGRLGAFERVLFERARPGTVAITTPNAEYNIRFETLEQGRFRHRDHRFEWTRAQLAAWAAGVAERHGYSVSILPVGPEDAEVGAPSQMAVFTRA